MPQLKPIPRDLPSLFPAHEAALAVAIEAICSPNRAREVVLADDEADDLT